MNINGASSVASIGIGKRFLYFGADVFDHLYVRRVFIRRFWRKRPSPLWDRFYDNADIISNRMFELVESDRLR